MDMHVFQIESNKVDPAKGNILISSPFLSDYHFTRSVVLLVEHDEEGSMGIIMNKDFRYHVLLNDLIPALEFAPPIPVYKGGLWAGTLSSLYIPWKMWKAHCRWATGFT